MLITVRIDSFACRPLLRDLFPIDPAVLCAIKEDMEIGGFDQSKPVDVWKDGGDLVLVDGYTRCEAARRAGIEEVPAFLHDFPGEDVALQYAISNQRNRRNLTGADILRCIATLDQRRMSRGGGDRRSTEVESKAPRGAFDSGKSSEETAHILGVSPRTVERARTVLDHGDESIRQGVEAGMSINEAYKETQRRRREDGEQQPPEESTGADLEMVAPPPVSKGATLPMLPPVAERGLHIPTESDLAIIKAASRATFNKQDTDNIEWAKWSWNPVTGCLHNCPYCLSGDTLILMADGSAKPLRDVRVGDKIIGTKKGDSYRHYAETTVLAHWETLKPAYRITLANGTTIISSGDHRFLNSRQTWKYVQKENNRAALSAKDALMGLGSATVTPPETMDYRRGYVAGIIEGDGHLKAHQDKRRQKGFYYSFRLALKDESATKRADDYLRSLGVESKWFTFTMNCANSYEVGAIRTSTKDAFHAIQSLIAEQDSMEFRRGYVAGMVDAEGSNTGNSGSVIRIFNSDLRMLAIVERALSENGFQFTYDKDRQGKNRVVRTLRVTGGLKEHVRLFQWANPCLRRRLKIDGGAVKSNADTRIVSVEPLGIVMPMYDITTETEDFIANGVIAHNCYARDIAARFYEQGFTPTFLPERLSAPTNTKVPAAAEAEIGYRNVFVCSMADLWGKWVPSEVIRLVLAECNSHPEWNFLFLTKFPQRYEEFASEFGPNCWIGTSVDNQNAVARAEKAFRKVMAAGHQGIRWLSCEPLMERVQFSSLEMFHWAVIGGASRSTQTPEFVPPYEWHADLWKQARAAGCKVYHKTNLGIDNRARLREYPGMASKESNEVAG